MSQRVTYFPFPPHTRPTCRLPPGKILVPKCPYLAVPANPPVAAQEAAVAAPARIFDFGSGGACHLYAPKMHDCILKFQYTCNLAWSFCTWVLFFSLLGNILRTIHVDYRHNVHGSPMVYFPLKAIKPNCPLTVVHLCLICKAPFLNHAWRQSFVYELVDVGWTAGANKLGRYRLDYWSIQVVAGSVLTCIMFYLEIL